ncbi:MAG: helix-turn-helix domain-containing protein [Lachnospiraceae bacterium]|nr:helix-turn-helix domain-containing protein [Lachnospiraceae bacterium]
MTVSETIREILSQEGRTQIWVVDKMNEIMPELGMDRSRFSGIVTGHRNMTADELLAFCKALEISPDVFLN